MTPHSLEYCPQRLSDNVTIQTPLTRSEKGPGLVILMPKEYQSRLSTDTPKTLDPEPQQKWAEEGFAVVEVKVDPKTVADDIKTGLEAIKKLPQCSEYKSVGLIGMF